MYKIESKEYGFKLTFSDTVTIQELESWIEESEKLFPTKSNEERYIDAGANPNWEAEGLEWIKNGKEPSIS